METAEECPFCKSTVTAGAKVCGHCGAWKGMGDSENRLGGSYLSLLFLWLLALLILAAGVGGFLSNRSFDGFLTALIACAIAGGAIYAAVRMHKRLLRIANTPMWFRRP